MKSKTKSAVKTAAWFGGGLAAHTAGTALGLAFLPIVAISTVGIGVGFGIKHVVKRAKNKK